MAALTACNRQPPEEHPFHATGVACYFKTSHAPPCSWSVTPSTEIRALVRLREHFPEAEFESADLQHPRPVIAKDLQTLQEYVLTTLPAGPWITVKFKDHPSYAIWKATGATFEVDEHGAVLDEPFLPPLTDQ